MLRESYNTDIMHSDEQPEFGFVSVNRSFHGVPNESTKCCEFYGINVEYFDLVPFDCRREILKKITNT